ncbi:MAG: hypothetical protein DMF94_12710 [Acidobacteria bacterium]|nr:MAG: hypothetical protein DMF94_12710 [Acidobacteriota bacterium]
MTRRQVWLTLQVVVTVILLALLFRRFDWAAFGLVLRRMSLGFYVGSLLAIVAGQLLYALRWQVVLRGMGRTVSYRDVLEQYLIGLFFSNLIPTAVGGDAAKVYYLGRRAGYVEVGASVFVDRFLGFLWLAIVGATLAWYVGAGTPLFILNRNLLTIFAFAFATMLAAAWVVPFDRVLAAGPWPRRFAPWMPRLRELVTVVRAGACRPATLAVSASVTLGYVLLVSLVYVRYFEESGVPVAALLPVTSIIISMAIFVNVPISVNGIGLREQLHSLLFATIGVPKEVSVSLALLVFAHMLLLSAAGYLAWLRARPVGGLSPS